jgi:hypothetical protein
MLERLHNLASSGESFAFESIEVLAAADRNYSVARTHRKLTRGQRDPWPTL